MGDDSTGTLLRDGETLKVIGSGGVTVAVAEDSSLTGDSVVTITAGGSATFTSVTTSDITITGQIIESLNNYTQNISSGGTVTLDCSTGNLWRIHTGTVSGNWTAALTNVTIANNQATNVTLVISQGATAYIPTALTVNGTSVTISWLGGSAPTPNASKQDAVAFSILQTAATPTFLVLGQLVSFG